MEGVDFEALRRAYPTVYDAAVWSDGLLFFSPEDGEGSGGDLIREEFQKGALTFDEALRAVVGCVEDEMKDPDCRIDRRILSLIWIQMHHSQFKTYLAARLGLV